MNTATNWGNYPVVRADWYEGNQPDKIKDWLFAEDDPVIPRGLGRCYGDSSLGERIWSSNALDRILAFDPVTGMVRCEGGVSLDKIITTCLSAGWFIPVTPGTRYVTIGGGIASDIHGKNHHSEGTFSRHVLSLTLLAPDGRIVTCSPSEQPELFHATSGGMGLTGIILQATMQLKKVESAWIKQVNKKAANLEEVMALFDTHIASTYSVAWIDTLASGKNLGRSILMLGEHALASEVTGNPFEIPAKRKITIPPFFPSFLLNRLSVTAFNKWFYFRNANRGEFLTDYDEYFYPLDSLLHWNRIYGKKGFTQYQLVVPIESGKEALTKILDECRSAGYASFLSVLKLFGDQAPGMISFPKKGYTLTLDFPLNKGLLPFLERLDAIVKDYNGRLYLAKDVRMSEQMFFDTYPGAEDYRNFLKQWDPDGRFASLQSRRIGLSKIQTTNHNGSSMEKNTKSVLVIGASSGLGRALAKKYAQEKWEVTLASRDVAALNLLAGEIEKESGKRPAVEAMDVAAMETHRSMASRLAPDTVICCAGYLGNQENAMEDPEEFRKLMDTNFYGPASLFNEWARVFARRKSGCLIGVSSVAGDRGRQSNYAYGSAKAGFTAYLSGLRNRLQPDNVHVMTVIPGFMRTAMTEGLPLPAPLTASPEQAANDIYKAHMRRKNVVYTLWMWKYLMMIIKMIPEPVFKKLKL
ncbi:MAG: SDR family oxidoreductase [Flavobacteriales bacterium]|nr:SDR family oxidoreductase [Flavobacteriales bacterium]